MTRSLNTLLSIDTSGNHTCAALCMMEGSQIGEIYEQSVPSNSHDISSLCEAIFEASKARASDLDGILIGSGPGSFTGLRIGYSFAKGLAFRFKLPLIEIPTHRGLWRSCIRTGKTLIVGDAGRNEYYSSLYSINEMNEEEICFESEIFNTEELRSLVERYSRLKETYLCSYGANTPSIDCKHILPGNNTASGLLSEWIKSGSFGSFSLDQIAQAAPHYVRAVAAKTISERRALNISM